MKNSLINKFKVILLIKNDLLVIQLYDNLAISIYFKKINLSKIIYNILYI